MPKQLKLFEIQSPTPFKPMVKIWARKKKEKEKLVGRTNLEVAFGNIAKTGGNKIFSKLEMHVFFISQISHFCPSFRSNPSFLHIVNFKCISIL